VRFAAAGVEGALLIQPEPSTDERGLFARTVDADTFAAHGLPRSFAQWSVSFNPHVGTLRGLHYQRAPHEETKLVRCTRGRVQDVVVDLRRGSVTYLRHVSVELSADNRVALLVPPGCAHGFLTLEPDTELLYGIDQPFVPDSAAGARWDDPAFAISWAAPPQRMNERDRTYPDHV
jgi:dTDP-4-dehydrorhamnose 3,5-epimerase